MHVKPRMIGSHQFHHRLAHSTSRIIWWRETVRCTLSPARCILWKRRRMPCLVLALKWIRSVSLAWSLSAVVSFLSSISQPVHLRLRRRVFLYTFISHLHQNHFQIQCRPTIGACTWIYRINYKSSPTRSSFRDQAPRSPCACSSNDCRKNIASVIQVAWFSDLWTVLACHSIGLSEKRVALIDLSTHILMSVSRMFFRYPDGSRVQSSWSQIKKDKDITHTVLVMHRYNIFLKTIFDWTVYAQTDMKRNFHAQKILEKRLCITRASVL